MTTFNLTSRADLERACDVFARANAPVLPMVRAAADGIIDLVNINDPKAKWPKWQLSKLKRPVLVVIGDDLEPERPSTLPSGWHCARMLRAWAKTAIVHGSGGEAAHYRAAVGMALATGRAAMIETNSACVEPWVEFLAPMPFLAIVPRSGSHPVVPQKGAMQ